MKKNKVGIFQNTIKPILLFILSYPFRILAILGMSSLLLLVLVVLILIIVNIMLIMDWLFDLINVFIG